MKNLLIFLFGFGFGAGGTILWLRKDIRKELEAIKSNNVKEETKEEQQEKESVPFTVTDEARAEYHKIVTAETTSNKVDETNDISGNNETDGGIFEINVDEFMHEHTHEKERLVYYRGDRVMSTESGTIIINPFPLVGGEWEQCVGNYADRTAFIRNEKLVTDYEIYVEDGLYEDEYGVEANYKED